MPSFITCPCLNPGAGGGMLTGVVLVGAELGPSQARARRLEHLALLLAALPHACSPLPAEAKVPQPGFELIPPTPIPANHETCALALHHSASMPRGAGKT